MTTGPGVEANGPPRSGLPAPERGSIGLGAAERLHGRIVDSYRGLDRNFTIETDPVRIQIREIAHFPAAADYVSIADQNRDEASPSGSFRTGPASDPQSPSALIWI
jgi:hypothetical protein